MKRLLEILQIICEILVIAMFIILMLAMSFIPYEPVTQEDIDRMELMEKMRYEQMVW